MKDGGFTLGPISHAAGVAREPGWLERLKRRAYVTALTLVAIAAVLGFALHGLSGRAVWVRLLYGPVAAVVSLGVAFAIQQRRLALRRVEAVGYMLAATMLVVHVGVVLFGPSGDGARMQFSAFAPWIAGVFMLGFLMLETRTALFAAVGLYGSLLLLAVGSRLPAAGLGAASLEVNALVQQFVFANGFYIALLYVLARVKEEYGKAEYKSLVMDRLAHHDELTGSPNRRYLVGACSKEMERLGRRERPFCMVLIDLDHFKQINDRYGHAAGDAVLCAVAALLPRELRGGDDFGRWGGEEFVVLAYEADPATGFALAERLRARLERTEWRALGLPRITASFGVANFRTGDDFHSLLARADRALYRAKQSGRNCVADERYESAASAAYEPRK